MRLIFLREHKVVEIPKTLDFIRTDYFESGGAHPIQGLRQADFVKAIPGKKSVMATVAKNINSRCINILENQPSLRSHGVAELAEKNCLFGAGNVVQDING